MNYSMCNIYPFFFGVWIGHGKERIQGVCDSSVGITAHFFPRGQRDQAMVISVLLGGTIRFSDQTGIGKYDKQRT